MNKHYPVTYPRKHPVYQNVIAFDDKIVGHYKCYERAEWRAFVLFGEFEVEIKSTSESLLKRAIRDHYENFIKSKD